MRGSLISLVRAGLCILCLCFGPGSAVAPAEHGDEDESLDGRQSSSIIRVSTNLVTVPVSVTDSAGCEIGDLEMEDFLIEEDGRPETIFRLAPSGQSQLRLALLFDLSGSVNAKFAFEQWAAARFLEQTWKPGDTVSIVAFSERPRVLLRQSGSLQEALRAISTLEPTEGPTAFFDSVVISSRILRQYAEPEARQAVVALSDGEDNRSRHDLYAALHEAHRADATFYAINPGGSSIRLNEISLKGQSDLTLLARETGGNAFVSDQTGDLHEIFGRIAAELRAQYLLSYYSTDSISDGKYRRISVSIPSKPHLRVRTRRGYYADSR